MAVLLDLDERLCAALLGLLRAVLALSHRSGGNAARAAAGGVALALRWIVYDFLCRSPLAANEPLLGLVGFDCVVATSSVFALDFSGRGAFIHTGGLMATIVTAMFSSSSCPIGARACPR